MGWFMQIMQSSCLPSPPVPPSPPAPSWVAVLYLTLSGIPTGTQDTPSSAEIPITTFLKTKLCYHFDGTEGS